MTAEAPRTAKAPPTVFPRVQTPQELGLFRTASPPSASDSDDAAASASASTPSTSSKEEGPEETPDGAEPPPPHGLPLVHVKGRVCARRELGKAMCFFDLVDPAIESKTGDGDKYLRMECLLHGGGLAGLTHAEARARRHRIKMGDVVRVSGYVDESRGHYILEARRFAVLECWRDTHEPRVAFVLGYPIDEPDSDEDEEFEGHGGGDGSSEKDPALASTPPRIGEVCKYWINGGQCFRRSGGCPKFHPPLSKLARYRTAWVRHRARERALASHLEGDTHDPLQDKTHKAARATIFADWLAETYGTDFLRAAGGVCDVAGGHGDVSARLWCAHGVPCTVIDPRAVGLRRRQRKQVEQKGMEGVGRLTCEMRVGRRFRPPDEDSGEEEGEQQAKLRVALEGCALLIGMHPDEATDAIVDVAHEYGKPFAVLPCCVFSRLFPHRRTPDGREVDTYEDLVSYLMAKPCVGEGGAQRHFLPFQGRNQVIYSLPDRKDGEGIDAEAGSS